ncbi:DUF2170 family protein [Massilia sp. W12]|uniref:DUF2170 family protein n=1 Tax=Massilia sp. W12 TaxID=3126507 RepID=UPI0030D5CA40
MVEMNEPGQASGQLSGLEQALGQRLGATSFSVSKLPAADAQTVPVLRISIENREELPVFVTVSPSQILCICYLWREAEINPARRSEMHEAMLDLNVAIPLSHFGRIGQHYVIFGALATDARVEDVAHDVVMLADNALEALDVFAEYLLSV